MIRRLLLVLVLPLAACGETSHSSRGCQEALEAADELIDFNAEVLGLMVESFDALSRNDIDRLNRLTSQLDLDEAERLRVAYDKAAEECRDV